MKRENRQPSRAVAVAACVAELDPKVPSEVRLTPAGSFRARDGRPEEVPAWRMDAAIAARVIAQANAAVGDFVVDYEHQTLNAEANGQPAPAAGWFKQLEWREGDGLYAVNLRWTDRATAAIAAGEYRYISPVFAYDKRTGEVLAIQMAALTNFPALDGLDDLAARAAAKFQTASSEQENDDMKREDLIKLLGLADTATDDEINQAIVALKAKADAHDGLQTEVAALKAKVPDLGKFVSIEVHQKLATDLAALKGDLEARDLSAAIQGAIDEGRLPVAEEPWARDFAKHHGLAALKSSLEKRPVIAALKGTQTGGRSPAGTGQGGGLDDTALAVCKQIGVDVEDFKKTAAAA